MKLTNLQLRLHGKAPLEHRITYQNERGTQCRETLCSGEEFAQHVIDCLEAVPVLRTERDELQGTINGLKQLVELPESAGLTELFNTVEALELNKSELLATQPQLSEIRYVLHGDIQPCTVLYSDDTTTLLRLDEGDIMCETDTIEWSDSVTYRCQELLRGARVPVSGNRVSLNTVKIVAQLVRDERILLNDNGDDELPRPAVVIPTPPCVPATPSCGNPYVHDNFAYLEDAMRAAGWTTEDLVQNGYGHYQPVPMQRTDER